ncbi:uncharacterized protein SCHCODRAFT_02608454 [Schizophyllum commune H4-8]|uniref:Uncharacterized protein n=1 Tax=Schizophyllum commune (strain H4-8 / FGSC 9210) TaxID=578458 RepID=D8PUK1_SCHCM|nr:uncharacterized protein SCHCODRAFT_02608454 [Schizophyllum commune H4-8]KAI5900641.1 hypothetical protein SCHCODRAFT_02608454 [Schizophyllum commune H4-8]
MDLPYDHKRFLHRLRKLTEMELPPLASRKQATQFQRESKARMAALKAHIKPHANVIGRAPRAGKKAAAAAEAAGGTHQSGDRDPPPDRLAAILARPRDERSVEDVWRIAVDPPEPLSRAETEDGALHRLLCGIEQHSSKVWHSSSPADEVTQSMAAYNAVDAHGDDGVLLVQLHNRIHTSEVSRDLVGLRRHLQIQADTIEFGLRWLTLGGQGGRSVQKEEFFKSVWFSQYPQVYVTALDKAGVEQDPDFVRWKQNVMRPIVTGRNRLVQVYKKFGLLVLLDPFWTVKSLQPNSRTREFTAILNAFLQLQEADRDFDHAVIAFLKGFQSRSVAERLFEVENEEEETEMPADTSTDEQ